MAKGDVQSSEKIEFKAPETGARIIQLTDTACYNSNPYYNQNGFVGGSEAFVIASNRSGRKELYLVEIATGKIVQLTETPDHLATLTAADIKAGAKPPGSSKITVDWRKRIVYYVRKRELLALNIETLKEEVIVEAPDGLEGFGGADLSTCGRYMVLAGSHKGKHHSDMEHMNYRHGSEGYVILVDIENKKQSIVYHGPSPENPAAPDSHFFICRGDPSYLFFGSYSRMLPTGHKTMWFMRVDLETMRPLQDPLMVFDQQPYEFVNHYYPAPNTHVESLMRSFTEHDRDGVRTSKTWLTHLVDTDLKTRSVSRWAFPGMEPLHFKCDSRGELWAGDCADPGFLWFEGRGTGKGTSDEPRETAPFGTAFPVRTAVASNADYWSDAKNWIGVFKKRGPYLEVRPLVRHDTEWEHAHPHPAFSPDDKWIAYRSGTQLESHVFLAEAVWPKWFDGERR